ncbi:TPR repeat [Halorhodospira halochloris]|uniref:TPR repeat n=1 Tax=Halorhodospira halochloris TaxID=1052 RepID=A0A0X8X7I1_HALHR|nr:tetratricopeptide repeat protein [Halorhodospira halochloris]MBK1651027.1 hypothetical protein [Halorhodospira halochloris]BAU56462.1 TPR repeat [Halorhodospira halochloris]
MPWHRRTIGASTAAAVLVLAMVADQTSAQPLEGQAEASLVAAQEHITDHEARHQLARLLSYQPERWEQALHHYRRLLEDAPEDPELITDTAKLLYWKDRPGAAARLLDSLPEQTAQERASLLLQARIENALGRVGQALDILEGLSPLDGREEQLQYTETLIRSGALHRAEAILREFLAQQPEDREFRLRLGDLLQTQGRHYAAEHHYTHLLAEAPEDEVILGRLKGLAAATGFHSHPPPSRAPDADPLAAPPLARYAAQQVPDPEHERKAQPTPPREEAETIPPHEREAPSGEADPEAARELFHKAQRLTEQGEIQQAEETVREALAHEPELTLACYLHADLLLSLGALDAAESRLEALAERFPDATQPRLALARLASWQDEFDRSRELYDALARAYPEDPTFAWEAARVAWWAGEHEESLGRYEALLVGSQEAWVEHPELGVAADAILQAGDPPFAELEARLIEHGEPIADHPDYPRYALQKAVYLEGRSKLLVRQQRPREALSVLQRATHFQPGNQKTLLDQAQVACSLGLCELERETYQQLLDIEPQHGQARQGLELLRRERSPKAGVQAAYRSESGQETEIEVSSYGLHGSLPVGRRAHGEVTVDRLHYDFNSETPEALDQTRGSRIQGALTGVAGPQLLWRAELAHTRLDEAEARNATEGRTQAEYHPDDHWRAGAALARQRVLRNARTAQDRVYRRVVELELDHYPHRRIDLTSRAELADYSDDNRGYLLELQPRARITDHPRKLTLGLTLQYRDYDEDDEDNSAPENGHQNQGVEEFGYWTPQRYVAKRLFLEWRHDLAEVFACRALAHHYRLRVAPYTDSDGNSGARWSLAYIWDASERLQLSADTFLERSSEWDTEGLALRATWHFH